MVKFSGEGRTIVAVCVLCAAAFVDADRLTGARGQALSTPGFHHLHLNSVNPEAAITFYTAQFPSTARGEFSGQPALRSPNNVWVLFTRVDTPPATQPQTAYWHFGWHVTDVHKTLDSYKQRALTLLPL